MHYILNPDHSTQPATLEEAFQQWKMWDDLGAYVAGHPKVVAKTQIGNVEVSTVFLTLDHGFGSGPPILFETMVFDGSGNGQDCVRYATWDEAVEGHEKIVQRIRGSAEI
jgi:hypothetical protein